MRYPTRRRAALEAEARRQTAYYSGERDLLCGRATEADRKAIMSNVYGHVVLRYTGGLADHEPHVWQRVVDILQEAMR